MSAPDDPTDAQPAPRGSTDARGADRPPVRWSALVPLAAYWLLFFAGMGLLFPFNALYLSEQAGLNPWQVGLVLATLPAIGLVAQPLWGNAADRTGRRRLLLVLLAAGSSAALLLFSTLEGFAALLSGMALVAAFQTSVVPSLTAVTFALLEGRRRWFGFLRAWGTAGFALLVLTFPFVLDTLAEHAAAPGEEARRSLSWIYVLAAGFNLCAAFCALMLPRTGTLSLRAGRGDWRALLRHRPYVLLLVVVFLGFFTLHGPMVLFPVYIRELGGGLDAVSHAWAYMLALEIPLVLLAPLTLRRFDARLLVAVGLLAGGLRWVLCSTIDSLAVALPVQLLHALTVVGVLVGAQLYSDAVVPPALRSTGQSGVAMTGAGLGGILSSTVAGYAMHALGVRAPYLIGGAGALALGIAALALLPAAGTEE